MEAEAMKALAAGLCMGLGALGPALGEGYIGGQAMKVSFSFLLSLFLNLNMVRRKVDGANTLRRNFPRF